MLKFILIIFSISTSFASIDCLTITDSLDREYCFKKSLRSEELKLKKQLETLKKSLSADQKNQVISQLDFKIQRNKEEASYLLKKQAIFTSHKEKISKLSITKKKKKKNKLKDSLKKLGIKL